MQSKNYLLTSIPLQFIASAALVQAKSAHYNISPDEAINRQFRTSLSLGTNESASDIVMVDAVCSVSLARNIVRTSLVGMSGTIKEYVSAGDYEVKITVGLVAVDAMGEVIDQYPADGVRDLTALLNQPNALYVDSEFLQLFDITRLVVVDFQIQQMTHSNTQIVTISAISDTDYQINCNDY